MVFASFEDNQEGQQLQTDTAALKRSFESQFTTCQGRPSRGRPQEHTHTLL